MIACFVGAWAVLDLGKGKKNAMLPPQPPPPQKENRDILLQLPLDLNGKANVGGNIPIGGDCVYRVFIQRNQRYNVLVSGNGFLPRVEVRDGNRLLTAGEGGNRCLLTFTPTQSDEALIRIADPQGGAGNFRLNVTRAEAAPPTQIDLAAMASFQSERTLRLEDPVCQDFHSGPCQRYVLNVKPGEKYQFKIRSAELRPVLRLQNGGALIHQVLGDGIRDVEFTYIVQPNLATITICVSSQAKEFGKYTLNVTRLAKEKKFEE